MHKRCSDIKAELQKVNDTFVCKQCSGVVAEVNTIAITGGMDIGNGDAFEYVEKFCYLGDMINADGGADSAVVARVRSAWKKFRELSPILTQKGASLMLT